KAQDGRITSAARRFASSKRSEGKYRATGPQRKNFFPRAGISSHRNLSNSFQRASSETVDSVARASYRRARDDSERGEKWRIATLKCSSSDSIRATGREWR